MSNFTRRDFLRTLIVSGAFCTAAKGKSLSFAAGNSEALEFLVIGDSFVWGQGLAEKDKFYSITAEWLRADAFSTPKTVDLKVKAHSGSTIKLHADAADAYKKAGRDEAHYYKPEVNVGFPSMWKQIEVAANEYKAAGKTGGADLIMLTGGITDISVAKLLDPFGDISLLPGMIEKYCFDHMFELLEHAANHNPNALLAVVGYFPIVSPKTHGSKLFNSWLESMSFPRVLKPITNNSLTRTVLFKSIRKKAIKRSRVWFDDSNRHLKAAVDRLNAKYDRPRAVFVRSPISEDTCLETPNTLLFRMGKKGRSDDALYDERRSACREALPELKKSTGLDYPVKYCEIAAVGHPDPAGSRAYADAIKSALAPLLR